MTAATVNAVVEIVEHDDPRHVTTHARRMALTSSRTSGPTTTRAPPSRAFANAATTSPSPCAITSKRVREFAAAAVKPAFPPRPPRRGHRAATRAAAPVPAARGRVPVVAAGAGDGRAPLQPEPAAVHRRLLVQATLSRRCGCRLACCRRLRDGQCRRSPPERRAAARESLRAHPGGVGQCDRCGEVSCGPAGPDVRETDIERLLDSAASGDGASARSRARLEHYMWFPVHAAW